MTLRIAVHGAAGRMGREVCRLVADDPGLVLASAVDRSDHPALGASIASGVALTANVEDALVRADVAIDFSSPSALVELVQACIRQRKPLIVGTTGLGSRENALLAELSQSVAVVVAPNMSAAVAVFFELAGVATRMLGGEFNAEVIEVHHKNKIDAPSGTALRLVELVAFAKGIDATKDVVCGRSGVSGARPVAQVGVHSVRAGDVVGEHTLLLAGPGERIELSHRAHTREIFARGALRAARWCVGRNPGRYTMTDVVAERSQP